MSVGKKLKYELLNKQSLYKGFFELNKYQFKNELFAGGWSQIFEREVFERGHAVAVLLLDIHQDEIVLVEQFRPGAVGWTQSPWIIELVAGMIETGESAENVAIRESIEETGCYIKRLSKICDYLVSPGGTTETICLMLGEIDSTKVDQFGGLVDEHEDIKIHKIKVNEAFEMLENGAINNAMTIIGIQWLKLNWQRKHEFWS